MPGFFSPLGAFGKAMVPLGSAAGTAYQGFSDYNRNRLMTQLALAQQQREQQKLQLEALQNARENNLVDMQIAQEQFARQQAQEQQQANAKMLAGFAMSQKDPQMKAQYAQAAMAVLHGAPMEGAFKLLKLDDPFAQALLAARATTTKQKGAEAAASARLKGTAADLLMSGADGDGDVTSGAPPEADYSKMKDGVYIDKTTHKPYYVIRGTRIDP